MVSESRQTEKKTFLHVIVISKNDMQKKIENFRVKPPFPSFRKILLKMKKIKTIKRKKIFPDTQFDG